MCVDGEDVILGQRWGKEKVGATSRQVAALYTRFNSAHVAGDAEPESAEIAADKAPFCSTRANLCVQNEQ